MTDAFLTYVAPEDIRDPVIQEDTEGLRTRPIFAKAASRSRVSTLWLRPETWRLFPGLCLPSLSRLVNESSTNANERTGNSLDGGRMEARHQKRKY